MRKFVLSIVFCFFVIVSPIFSSNYNSLKNLSVIDTEHFDILYPDKAEEYALQIAEYAEENLTTLNEYFGSNWQPKNYKIVITNDIDNLNAYYTPLTKDHIFMFNTMETTGEIEYYSNVPKSILLHEMGHAYILNNISKEKKFLQNIVGPALNNSLFLKYFDIEGLSVALESAENDGRLNDPFVMQKYRLAALNGSLYSYRKLSGAIETYPALNSAYIVGGAFFDFLRNNYSHEKFYTFIKNLKSAISMAESAEKAYGVKFNRLYTEFLNYLSGEEIDFKETQYLTKKPSKYNLLTATRGGMYYTDSVQSGIFRFSSGDKLVIDEIAQLGGVIDLKVQREEKYMSAINVVGDELVFNLYQNNYGNYKKLYSIKGVFDSGFINTEQGVKIALLRYNKGTLNKYLQIIDASTRIETKHLDLGNTSIFGLCEFGDSTLSFIKKDSSNYSIAFYDYKTSTIQTVDFGDEYIIKNLCTSIYLEKDALVVLKGKKGTSLVYPIIIYTNDDGEIAYTEVLDNLQDGVKSACLLYGNLIYASDGYAENTLRYLPINELELTDEVVLEKSLYTPTSVRESSREGIERKIYNHYASSFPFTSGHLLYPGVVTSKDSRLNYSQNLQDGIALSLLSTDYSEQVSQILSFEYVPGADSLAGLNYTTSFETKNDKYSLYINPLLKFGQEHSLYADFDAGFSLSHKKNINFKKSLLIDFNVGYDAAVKQSKVYKTDGFYTNFYFKLNSLVKKGWGINEYSGFSYDFYCGITDINSYYKENNDITFNPNVYSSFRFYIPHLLPISNTRKLTTNLPISFALKANYLFSQQSANQTIARHNVAVDLSSQILLYAISFVESELELPFVFKSFILQGDGAVKYINTASNGEDVNGIVFSTKLTALLGFSPTFLGSYFTAQTYYLGYQFILAQSLPNSKFDFSSGFIFNLSISV